MMRDKRGVDVRLRLVGDAARFFVRAFDQPHARAELVHARGVRALRGRHDCSTTPTLR